LAKLIIQIPCYNEEETLGVTLSGLPRQVPGADRVEWLVIDDGSTDRTVEVARAHGADHIIRHPKNLGLARAFISGLEASLAHGADIIVNIDADNQYCADCIEDLIRPIVENRAEIVVGARPIDEIEDFSWTKKTLQKVGSWVVRLASGTDIPDAPSGFRAFSREAAMRTRVYSNYTYTLETIIQAGQRGICVTSVPIRTNRALRPSRLVGSLSSYILKSILIIVRIFVVYRPFRFFLTIGLTVLLLGALIGLRFLWFYFTAGGSGHIQSLILASILIGIGFQTVMVAFLADLLSVNRRLAEDNCYQFLKTTCGHVERRIKGDLGPSTPSKAHPWGPAATSETSGDQR
jgi:glycosyltransferase involved in cell wall biosynthesis